MWILKWHCNNHGLENSFPQSSHLQGSLWVRMCFLNRERDASHCKCLCLWNTALVSLERFLRVPHEIGNNAHLELKSWLWILVDNSVSSVVWFIEVDINLVSLFMLIAISGQGIFCAESFVPRLLVLKMINFNLKTEWCSQLYLT